MLFIVMSVSHYDLCIIGGGINGAGIARDAAGRGLRVLLLEKDDLAQATSSASTKLVHGGLRYLEFYAFRLVRESLKERERLLKIAPHIIWPMEFVLPHHKAVRPLWMIKAGLYLYDRLGGPKKLKPSRQINLKSHNYGAPLKDEFAKGFVYTDCWVQDSRLVVLNAMDARQKGADIFTRCECEKIEYQNNRWCVKYKNKMTGEALEISASMLVNAAGPWVQHLLQQNQFYEMDKSIPKVKLVKGSHIIIPRAQEGAQCYILQQNDGRIVFSIPYENDYTLIGTTDVPYYDDAGDVRIDEQEMSYLLSAYNRFFKAAIDRKDILWTYSGVRALFNDGKPDARKVTRDYVLYRHQNFAAPFYSIFGGKITTYRQLSEKLVTMLLSEYQINKPSWTAQKPLPGGDFGAQSLEEFIAQSKRDFDWLPDDLLRRYANHYGTKLYEFLGAAKSLNDLGEHFGAGLYAIEIDYLVQREFALTAEDIIWRRTKAGMRLSDEEMQHIESYLNDKRSIPLSAAPRVAV
ncbi:MAG: glycerol-3-phosphate dehydrogenase [Alphaproteobacteria bacterium]